LEERIIMSTHQELLSNPHFIQDLEDYTLSSRKVASFWSVGKTFVNKHRAKLNKPSTVSTGNDAVPYWNPVQNARPVIVKPIEKKPLTNNGWKTAIVLPDPQIGYRLFDEGDEGDLDPFHDEAAMNVALQIIQHEENVHQVVNLGDFLDLPSQGRFAQEATFANMTQRAIDRGHYFLAQQRVAAPSAEIVLIEGNHDRRLQNFVEMNAVAAFGLKRAEKPSEWPVMSLPFLLRLDELKVSYIDSYPAGKHWINDKLRAIHGNKVRSNGSTAAAYTNDMPHISTIFGHTHRLEIQSKTTFDRVGKIRNMAISPGCLCRVDGAVPSVNGSIGVDGRPAQEFENWQQGIAVIKYMDTGEFFVDLVQIEDGRTVYQGKEFQAQV
jgi:predicted phosphodiesterase